jgi:hypothetical protein
MCGGSSSIMRAIAGSMGWQSTKRFTFENTRPV